MEMACCQACCGVVPALSVGYLADFGPAPQALLRQFSRLHRAISVHVSMRTGCWEWYGQLLDIPDPG